MPQRPMKLCAHPACGEIIAGKVKHCAKHRAERNREITAQRGTAHENGYTARWYRESRLFLRAHPMCECDECKGVRLEANTVDHIKPHRGDQTLFWDSSNWQAMSKRCHDRKTATHDGGFGRARMIYERTDARG